MILDSSSDRRRTHACHARDGMAEGKQFRRRLNLHHFEDRCRVEYMACNGPDTPVRTGWTRAEKGF
jgi:hypothetical protein